MMKRSLLVAALLLSACAPRRATLEPAAAVSVEYLRAAIDSMVADSKWRTAQLGILIVDPERSDTLYSHNAGKLFMPASNQKLLTGSVALELLGPDFRFSTTVMADGSVADGVLRGNLRFVGTGDPSVSDHMMKDALVPLRALADSLVLRGIRRIDGALVPGGDAFPDASLGFGWSWDDLDSPYAAGVDELYFNEGFFWIRLIGGPAPGTPVKFEMGPARTFPNVRMLVVTSAPRTPGQRARRLRLRHDSTNAGTVIVQGEIPANDTVSLSLTFRDHRRAFLEAVREALEERGVTVDSGVRLDLEEPEHAEGAMEPPGVPLFSLMSPPLSEVLRAFEKPSQNQIGEILLKTLGRSRTGIGRADSGARVVREQLLAWGARPDGFVVRDGSGLSRHNMVTPETIVLILDAMRKSRHAALFREVLPLAGVDGTIRSRMRGSPAEGNLSAKTGTLDMVRSLSGYVTAPGGRTILFSVLGNNFLVPNREVEAVQDAIGILLAKLQDTR